MPKGEGKDIGLVVIYTAPNEVAAAMLRGLLKCQGIPVMVHPLAFRTYV
ncbi:MAG: hypothetical protein AB1466_06680 [Actinomycetota bacterium]